MKTPHYQKALAKIIFLIGLSKGSLRESPTIFFLPILPPSEEFVAKLLRLDL
jgi:hypothetical protein